MGRIHGTDSQHQTSCDGKPVGYAAAVKLCNQIWMPEYRRNTIAE